MDTHGAKTARRNASDIKALLSLSRFDYLAAQLYKGESYEPGNSCWIYKESQWMVDALGHPDVCLWDTGH